MNTFISIFFYKTNILTSFFVLVPLAFLLRNNIRKYALWYYLGATLLTILSCGFYIYWFATNSFPHAEESWLALFINYLRRGAPGYVLFVIVMFQGVIKPWSKATRELLIIRGELAILASILSFIHILIYFVSYIIYLVMKQKYDIGYDILFYWTIAILVLMIPLFVTSFKNIRAKMKPLSWVKLHKYSYYFYFLLHFNVIFVFVRRIIFYNERFSENFAYLVSTYIGLIIYTLIFVIYTILRIKTSSQKRQALKSTNKK